jgi:hypothetical protein
MEIYFGRKIDWQKINLSFKIWKKIKSSITEIAKLQAELRNTIYKI